MAQRLVGGLQRRAALASTAVRRRLLAVLLSQLVVLGAPAAAVAACPRASLADLEDEVMCVVCGTTLGLATEAPQAQRTRQFILGQVERCRSKDEIKAALTSEFGPEVLADPAGEGFSLTAYLVPVLALLGAGAADEADGAGPRRRRRPRRRRPTPPGSRPTSTATSSEGAGG